MNKFEPQYQFVTPERYYQYINTLPPYTQLRFIAKTFLDRNRAVIMPMPHKDRSLKHTLLVPYYLHKSHLVDGEFMGFKLDHVIHQGIFRETTYRVSEYEVLGKPIEVANTFRGADGPHRKDIAIITDYYRRNEEEPYKRSLKIGEPVWMHNSLLPLIFSDKTIIDDAEKIHPQLEAYNRYMNWLTTSKSQRNKNILQKVLSKMLAYS